MGLRDRSMGAALGRSIHLGRQGIGIWDGVFHRMQWSIQIRRRDARERSLLSVWLGGWSKRTMDGVERETAPALLVNSAHADPLNPQSHAPTSTKRPSIPHPSRTRVGLDRRMRGLARPPNREGRRCSARRAATPRRLPNRSSGRGTAGRQEASGPDDPSLFGRAFGMVGSKRLGLDRSI